jgi:hypothetical protein
MHPSRQERQRHAQQQRRAGSSTDHRVPQRRLNDSYLRHERQDQDSWPPRLTSPIQQGRHAISVAIRPSRDRVNQPDSLAQGANRWIPSEADEHSQPSHPSERRWQSPEPTLRRSELDSSSVSRSWAQRHQDPHLLRAPRSLNVSRLGGGRAPNSSVHEPWASEFAKDARSTQPQWAPNAGHDAAAADDDDDDDADNDADDEKEENSDKQSNFTLEHRNSPPARLHECWKNGRAHHRLQRTAGHGPIGLSNIDHVGVSHNQVPSLPAHRQLSRRVEMSARRWSQSDNCFQDSQSEADQEGATQSLTTNSVDVLSDPMHPTKRIIVEAGEPVTSMVQQTPHTFEAGQASSLVDKRDERYANGESNAHSTSKRRPSARGKRKATFTHDVASVDCGNEPCEALVVIKPAVSGCESGIAKPHSHGTRKQYRKQCQYPEGCDKSAQGSTMLCKAHGGGKRCQYPEGCDKSAIGRTCFCIAHGGGKRCQYPQSCDKSAQGSTVFCAAHGGGKRCQYPEGCNKGAIGRTLFCKAHGGGKRCQYPEGCDKSAQGSTMFCKAHGGGKRCQYPEGCNKSAIGRTLFCKAHGGGKRCQYIEGCDKSARGSTMFCAAHGGGRRCGHESGCHKHVTRGELCRSHGADAGV